MITIEWTPEKKEAAIKKLEEWIHKYQAHSGEKIMQDDECQIHAPELISDLVDDIIKPSVNWDED